MQLPILLLLGFLGFWTLSDCSADQNTLENEQIVQLLTGAENTQAYFSMLKDKRLAVVVNQTSTIGQVHLVDSLLNAGYDIRLIFSPEHGFRGKADAGEKIGDSKDKSTDIAVKSLYGKTKKPDPSDLTDIDLILFDIQDVGVRFYTYLSTLHYVMEAASENDIPLIVLDRPNPNIDRVDGPVLDTNFSSFVGLHPVPVVYGMTIGEYAKMINGESWTKSDEPCDLMVVPCLNYHRDDEYVLPVKPSPNLPNHLSIRLYPSICFFEPTVISVGRGTSKAFQHIGHPDFKDYSYSFKPVSMEGAKYPKHEGMMCYGEDLSVGFDDVESLDLSWLLNYYRKCNERDISFFTNEAFFDKLAGTDQLRIAILEGKSEAEIASMWKDDLKAFKSMRTQYLIYNSRT